MVSVVDFIDVAVMRHQSAESWVLVASFKSLAFTPFPTWLTASHWWGHIYLKNGKHSVDVSSTCWGMRWMDWDCWSWVVSWALWWDECWSGGGQGISIFWCDGQSTATVSHLVAWCWYPLASSQLWFTTQKEYGTTRWDQSPHHDIPQCYLSQTRQWS